MTKPIKVFGDAFTNGFLARHGVPEVLITDNGDEFTALEWERYLKQLGIDHHRTTRRGLLNFIGIISNKLFGTATESQVKECRHLLINASISNRRISNLYN